VYKLSPGHNLSVTSKAVRALCRSFLHAVAALAEETRSILKFGEENKTLL
jgi:hypothetical protein